VACSQELKGQFLLDVEVKALQKIQNASGKVKGKN